MPEAQARPAQPDPENLLIRGVNWLGDAVMSSPALLRVRERLPGARISLLVPAKIKPLFMNHPAVDKVLSFSPGHGLATVARQLRGEKFDSALILPNSPRAALEPFLAGIPRRIGLARPWRRWLLTQNIVARHATRRMRKLSDREIHQRLNQETQGRAAEPAMRPDAHQVNDYLHLAAEAFGCQRAGVPPLVVVSSQEVEQALARFHLSADDRLVGLNPGAEYGPAKRWPAERFIEAARAVSRQETVRWLIFGATADQALAAEIAQALNAGVDTPALNLAGRTSLGELAALLKSCRVLLTNDTGPMHLAAALGTPVVVPFGSTSPELTGPLPQGKHTLLRVDVPCAPCFRRECPVDFRCMRNLRSEAAAAAVLKHLAGG